MADTFWQDRKTATGNQIIALEDAILALSSNTIQQYTLDTGQDRQVVTKADINRLQSTLDSLLNRYATLCARIDGSGSATVQPDW